MVLILMVMAMMDILLPQLHSFEAVDNRSVFLPGSGSNRHL